MGPFGQSDYRPYSRFHDSGSGNGARSFRDYDREYNDPRNLRGRVIGIDDADTVDILLPSGEQRTIRFAHIDAPEVKHSDQGLPVAQRGGEEARRRLEEIIPIGSSISVRTLDQDRYGRLVGEVYTSGSYVNLQLAREGQAHVYNFRNELDGYYQNYDFAQASARAYREGRPVSKATETPESWRNKWRGGAPLIKPEQYKTDRYSSGEFGFIYNTGYKSYSGAVPEYEYSRRAAKPLMPTKLDASFFDRYIGKNLPVYSSYVETYQAITEEAAPAAAYRMDQAISTPSLGHQINRALGFKFYTEGKGILGSIALGLGRTVDTLIGYREFEQDKLERSGQLRGGVRKFAALPYKEFEPEPGLFEKIAGATFEAAAGFSVAVFGYGLALTTQFTSSALFAKGVEHLASLEANRTPLQKLVTPAAFMSADEFSIDKRAQQLYREALEKGKPVSFQTALFHAERELFPGGSGKSPEPTTRKLTNLTGFISAQRRFEASVIGDLGRSLLEVVVPETNRQNAGSALEKLVRTIESPIHFSASQGRVVNYGVERVKEVAKEVDELTHFIPANLMYWIPQVRDFAGVKDIEDHSIAKVYGEGLLTQVIDSFVTTAKIGADLISNPRETLKAAKDLHQGGKSLYEMEAKLASHLRSKAAAGASSLEAELKALNSTGDSLYQNYIQQIERLNTRVQTYRGVNSFLSADPTAPLTKTQEKNRSSLQTLLLIGGVLAADYTFDQFVLKTQGATLHDQISLFRAVQGADGAVVRYEFNATMPVGVSLMAAATAGSAAGYLFPTVQTTAPSQQVLGRTLGAVRDASTASTTVRGLAEELLEVQRAGAIPFSNRIRFNKTAAAVGAVLGLMATKTAYVGVAGLMNSIYNRDPGVRLDGERDLTAGYLLKALNQTRGLVDSAGVTAGDIATREVLKNLVDSYKTSSVEFNRAQGFYSIAQQFSLGFVQFATLARADQRTGLTTYSFGFQVLPTLGIGFTPTLPFGLKREQGEQQQQGGYRLAQQLGVADNPLMARAASGAYGLFNTISNLTLLNSLGYMPGSMMETGMMAVGAYSLLGTIGKSALKNAKSAAPGTIRSNVLNFLRNEFDEARPLLNLVGGGIKLGRSAGLGIYGLSFAMPQTMGKAAGRFVEGTEAQVALQRISKTKEARAVGNVARRAAPFYLATAVGMALTDPRMGIEVNPEDGLFENPITRAIGVASVAGVYGGGMSTLGLFDSQERMTANLLKRNRLAEMLPGVQEFRRTIASTESTALRRGGARAGILASLLVGAKFGSMIASRAVGQIGGEEALQSLYNVAPILRIASGVSASEYGEATGRNRNLLLDVASDVLETLTVGGFKLTEALGLYKDDPNMFLPAFGFPFGISFREDGSIRTYTQLASPTADISYSVYGLFRPRMSKDMALRMDAIRQTDRRYLESNQAANVVYAMARGAVGRYKPASLADFTGYEISALGSSGLQRAFSRRKFTLTNIAFQRPSEAMMDLYRAGVLHGKVGLRGSGQKIPYTGLAPLDGLDLTFLPFFGGKPAGRTEGDLYSFMREQAVTRDRSVYLPKPFQQVRDLTKAFAGYGDPTASSLVMGGLSIGLALGSLVASSFTAIQLAAAVESSILGKTGRAAVIGRHNIAAQAEMFARQFKYESLVEDGQAYIVQSMTGGRKATGRVNVEVGNLDVLTKAVKRGFQSIGTGVGSYLARPTSLITGSIDGATVNLIDEVLNEVANPNADRRKAVSKAFAEAYQLQLQPLLKKQVAGKSLFERFFYPQVQNRLGGSLGADEYIMNYLDEVISPGAYSPLFEKAEELQRTGRLGQASTRDALNQLRAEIELKAYKQRLGEATPYRYSANDLDQLDQKLSAGAQIDLTTPVGTGKRSLYKSMTGAMRGTGSLLAKYVFHVQPFYGMAEGAAFMMSGDERQRKIGARAFTESAGYQLTSIALAKAVGAAFKTNPLASLIISGVGLAAYDTVLGNTGLGKGIKRAESAVGGLVSNVLAGVAGIVSPLTAPLGNFLRGSIFEPLGERIYSSYNQAGRSSMAAVMLAEFLLPQSIYKTGEQYRARRTVAGIEPFLFGDTRGYYRDQNAAGLMNTMSLNADIDKEVLAPFLLGKATGWRERMLYDNFFSLSPTGRGTTSPLSNFSTQSMYYLSETMRLGLERRQEMYAYHRYGYALRQADRGEDHSVGNAVSVMLANLDRKAIDLGIPVGAALSEELKSIRAGLTFGGNAYQQLAKAFPQQNVFGVRPPALPTSGVLGFLSKGIGLVDRGTTRIGSFIGGTTKAATKHLSELVELAARGVGTPFIKGVTSGLTTFRSNVLFPVVSGARQSVFAIKGASSEILSGLIDDFAPLAAQFTISTLHTLKTVGQYGVETVGKYGSKVFSKFTKTSAAATAVEAATSVEPTALQNATAAAPQVNPPSKLRPVVNAIAGFGSRQVKALAREGRLAAPVLMDATSLISGIGRVNQIHTRYSTGYQASKAYRNQASLSFGVIAGSLATVLGYSFLPTIAISLAAGLVGENIGRGMAIGDMLRNEEKNKQKLQLLTGLALATSFATNLYSRGRASLLDPTKVELVTEDGKFRAKMSVSRRTRNDLRYQPQGSIRRRAAQFEVAHESFHVRQARAAQAQGIDSYVTLQDHLTLRRELVNQVGKGRSGDVLNILDRMAQRSTQQVLSGLGDNLANFTQEDYQRIYEQEFEANAKAFMYQNRRLGSRQSINVLEFIDRRQAKGKFEGRVRADGRFVGIFDKLGANAYTPQEGVAAEGIDYSVQRRVGVEPGVRYAGGGFGGRIRNFANVRFRSVLNPLLEVVNSRSVNPAEKIANHAEPGAAEARYSSRVKPLQLLSKVGDATQLLMFAQNSLDYATFPNNKLSLEQRKAKATQIALTNVGLVQGSILQLAATAAGMSMQSRLFSFAAGLVLPQLGLHLSFGLGSAYAYTQGQRAEESGDLMPGVSSAAMTTLTSPGASQNVSELVSKIRPSATSARSLIHSRLSGAAGSLDVRTYLTRQTVKRGASAIGGFILGKELAKKVVGDYETDRLTTNVGYASAVGVQFLPSLLRGRRTGSLRIPNLLELGRLGANLTGFGSTSTTTKAASRFPRLSFGNFNLNVQRPSLPQIDYALIKNRIPTRAIGRAAQYVYNIPGRVSDRLFSLSQRIDFSSMPGRYSLIALGAGLGTYYLQDDYRKDTFGAAAMGVATAGVMAAPQLTTTVLNQLANRSSIPGVKELVEEVNTGSADVVQTAATVSSRPRYLNAGRYVRKASELLGKATAAGGLMFAGYVVGDILDQQNAPGGLPVGGLLGGAALGTAYLMSTQARGSKQFTSLGRYGIYGGVGAAAGAVIGGLVGAEGNTGATIGLGIGLALGYLGGDSRVRARRSLNLNARLMRGARQGGLRYKAFDYIQRKGGVSSAAFRGAEIGFTALDIYGAYSSILQLDGDRLRTESAVARGYQAQTSLAIAIGFRGNLIGGLLALGASPITNYLAEQRGRYLSQAEASEQDLLVQTTGDLVGSVRSGTAIQRLTKLTGNVAIPASDLFNRLQQIDQRNMLRAEKAAARAEQIKEVKQLDLLRQRTVAMDVLRGRQVAGAMSRSEALKVLADSNSNLAINLLRESPTALGRVVGSVLGRGVRTASAVGAAVRGTRAASKAAEGIDAAKSLAKTLKVMPIIGLAGTVIDIGVGGYNVVTGVGDLFSIDKRGQSGNLSAFQRSGEKIFGGAGRIAGSLGGAAVGEALKIAGSVVGVALGWTGVGAAAAGGLYSLGVATEVIGAEMGEFVFGKMGQAVGTAAWAIRNPQRAANSVSRNISGIYRSTAEFLGFNTGLNVGEVYTSGMDVESLYASSTQPSYSRRRRGGRRVISSNVMERRTASTGLYGRAEMLTSAGGRMVTDVASGSESDLERARRARLLQNRIMGRDRIRPYVSPSQAGYYSGGSAGRAGSVSGQYGTYYGPVGVTSGGSNGGGAPGQPRPMTAREGLDSVFNPKPETPAPAAPVTTGTYSSGEGDRRRLDGTLGIVGSSYNYRQELFGSAGEVEIIPGSGVYVTSGYGGRDPGSGGRTFHPGVDLATENGSLKQVNPFASARVLDAYGDAATLAELNPETGEETGRRVRLIHSEQIYVEAGQIIPFGTQVGMEGTSGGQYARHSHIEYFMNRPGTIDGVALGEGHWANEPQSSFIAPTREELIATTGMASQPLPLLREIAPGQFVTNPTGTTSRPNTANTSRQRDSNKQVFEYGTATGQQTGETFRSQGEVEMSFNLGAAVHFLNLNRQQQGVEEKYNSGRSFDPTQFLAEVEHVRGNKFSDEQRAQLQADIREHNRLVSQGFSIQYPEVKLETTAPAQPGANVVPSQSGSFYSGPPTTGRQVALSEAEFYQLATLANLEATTRQGALDVTQAIFNRLNSGNYGSSITEIMFAPGQFEPYFHVGPDQIRDEASAISYLQSRGYSADQARQTINEFRQDVADPAKMADARQLVGGRTGFKGTTMYQYRVAAEDPLRQEGENFFHIEGSQTYDQLRQYATRGPLQVTINSSNPNVSVYDAGTAEAGGVAQAAMAPGSQGRGQQGQGQSPRQIEGVKPGNYVRVIRDPSATFEEGNLLVQVVQNGSVVSTYKARSGRGSRQTFDPSETNIGGSYTPAPAGEYTMGPGEFFEQDYMVSLGNLGTSFIEMRPNFETGRSGLLFHADLDGPGTAGCIGLLDREMSAQLARQVNELGLTKLYVDYDGSRTTQIRSAEPGVGADGFNYGTPKQGMADSFRSDPTGQNNSNHAVEPQQTFFSSLRTLMTLGRETPKQSVSSQSRAQGLGLPQIPEFNDIRDALPILKTAPAAIAAVFDEVVKEYEKATQQIQEVMQRIMGVDAPSPRTGRIEITERTPYVSAVPSANYTPGANGKYTGNTPHAAVDYYGPGGGGVVSGAGGWSQSGGYYGDYSAADAAVGQQVYQEQSDISAGIGGGLSIGISESRSSGEENVRANTGSSSINYPDSYRHYGL